MCEKNQKLYLAQFIATLLVVVIHVGTITNNPVGHFILKSIVCRAAVPFFFVNNAYFFRAKCLSNESKRLWMRKIVSMYLAVFIIYIPFGIQMLRETMNMQLAGWQLPIVGIYSIIYSGSFLHLWYFPALIGSMWLVTFLIKKFGLKLTFSICLLLFLVGSLETYSHFITNPVILKLLHSYMRVFFTTRNGLFLSPIFIITGFLLADNRDKLINFRTYFKIGMGISLLVALIEGWVVYHNQGMDKNFMYFTLLFVACLFGLLITSKNNWQPLYKLKSAGQWIFLFHMVPIYVFNRFCTAHSAQAGIARTMLGISIPTVGFIVYEVINKLKQEKSRKLVCSDTNKMQ